MNSIWNETTQKTNYPKSEVLYRWSTEDCITLDKIPYIGLFSSLLPNVFVATGYKKWGMTSSFIAANCIFCEITGNSNEYYDIFKATRFSPIKNKNEMKNILKQSTTSLFINKIKNPIISINDLKNGEGGIVDFNGRKLAVYKKSENEVFSFKPHCTHLGCELSWNALEKTWDCPCHGSRYDYKGNLINEPSKKNLEPIN